MKTPLLAKIFIKNADNTADLKVRKAYGTLGGVFGIICNLILFAIKLIAGILSKSLSVTADAFNNLSDMGSSVVTMLGFRLSGKPADREHPFGHGRVEYMSALVVSFLIIMVGIELFKSSVSNIFNPVNVTFGVASIVILIVSILIKFFMFAVNRSLGKAINSSALTATAQDCINDTISTIAILISIPLSALLKFNVDAYVGLGISLFIIYSGIKTAKESLDPLLGTPPEPELIEQIENEINSVDDFVGMHDLIVHNYGPGRMFASVHVEVPQDIDIVQCHEKVDLCEKAILENVGIEIAIHMDPIDTNDENLSIVKAELSDKLKTIDERITLHDFRMTPKTENRTNLIFDVVVPSDFGTDISKLNELICEKAREIDSTFCCVITFDNDFSGR